MKPGMIIDQVIKDPTGRNLVVQGSAIDDYIINFIDITPRFLPVFAEKFSFEYLRKSHKIPLFSNKLVTPGYTRIRSSL